MPPSSTPVQSLISPHVDAYSERHCSRLSSIERDRCNDRGTKCNAVETGVLSSTRYQTVDENWSTVNDSPLVSFADYVADLRDLIDPTRAGGDREERIRGSTTNSRAETLSNALLSAFLGLLTPIRGQPGDAGDR